MRVCTYACMHVFVHGPDSCSCWVCMFVLVPEDRKGSHSCISRLDVFDVMLCAGVLVVLQRVWKVTSTMTFTMLQAAMHVQAAPDQSVTQLAADMCSCEQQPQQQAPVAYSSLIAVHGCHLIFMQVPGCVG